MGEEKMKAEKTSEKFVQNLLLVLPNWHSRLVRPFKDTLDKEMSLETYYCLETLRASGTVTMTELAHQLRVPKQQVTKLIDKLSRHQFVERVYKQDDRRAIWIQLTSGALTYLDEYYLKNKTFIQTLEERLTEEELEQLNSAAATLRDILPKLK